MESQSQPHHTALTGERGSSMGPGGRPTPAANGRSTPLRSHTAHNLLSNSSPDHVKVQAVTPFGLSSGGGPTYTSDSTRPVFSTSTAPTAQQTPQQHYVKRAQAYYTPPALIQSMLDQYQEVASGKRSPMSASQPDLVAATSWTAGGEGEGEASSRHQASHSQDAQQRRLVVAEELWRESQFRSGESGASRDPAETEARVTRRMLAMLAEENKSLRAQVAAAVPKTAKLAQLESQYHCIEREYADLVRRQERREELETEMRQQLDAQLRSLSDNNRRLQHQLDLALLKLQSMEELDLADQGQLRSFQAALAELRTDKATLAGIKERQELELEAQRATLEEQRTHIHILDKALHNAQEKVLRLDEELKRKTQLAERAELLEKALQMARIEIRKRDEAYQRRETQHQMDLAKPRGSGGGGRSTVESEIVRRLGEQLQAREAQLREYKERLAVLQADLAARSDTEPEAPHPHSLRHRDDPPAWDDHLSSRLAHLEERLRKQEEELAEKDGIIRALVASATRQPDALLHSKSPATYNTLEQTRQRLESARRRILESPSGSGSGGLGSRLNRLFSPRHARDFSSASLDRHHLHRLYPDAGRSGDEGRESGLPVPRPLSQSLHARTSSIDVPMPRSSPSGSSSEERKVAADVRAAAASRAAKAVDEASSRVTTMAESVQIDGVENADDSTVEI